MACSCMLKVPEAPTKKEVVTPQPPTTAQQKVDREEVTPVKKPVAAQGTGPLKLSGLSMLPVPTKPFP